jgi:translation initiation factor IF-1
LNKKKIQKEQPIKKAQHMKLQGIVTEFISGSNFKVKICNTEHIINAYLCGKMFKNTIHVLPGDLVDVEVSQYDLSRGRIKFRK